MSGKRVLDLIALLGAVKGVAEKHVALQSQYLDLHIKTSSLTRGIKSRTEHLCMGVQAARALSSRFDEVLPSYPEPGTLRSEPREGQQDGGVHQRGGNGSAETTDSHAGEASEVGLTRTAAGEKQAAPAAWPGPDLELGQVLQSPRLRHSFRQSAPDGVRGSQSQQHSGVPSDGKAAFKPAPWANYRPGGAPPQPSGDTGVPLRSPSPPSSPSATSTPGIAPRLASAPPSPPPPPPNPSLPSSSVNAEASHPRPHLVESRVPSSRLGRLWEYSGLATSMTFGVIGEGLRRATGITDASSAGSSLLLSRANVERLVAKLSRMRGAALKIGQMMSIQDAKMMPEAVREIMQRVQDQANYMPAAQRDRVLAADLGPQWRDLFAEFEDRPLAAASIGQVHGAVLKDGGQQVAVKVQYPGVADSIDSDLNNISLLLTASSLLPRGLYLDKTIANARTELAWECDYVREAECAARFRRLLADDPAFHVPAIYPAASGKRVLTMERVHGVPVTRIRDFSQEQRDWVGTQIMRLCFRELCEFRFMQTDPNWTNFLYNAETGKIELLDFGASREYDAKFIAKYLRVILAASQGDANAQKRDECIRLSQELGYLTGFESEAMVDAHIRSLLTLAEPYMQTAPDVYDFGDQTITDRVHELIPVMLDERLTPPPEETYSLHRKLSGAFLLCARLGSRVRCKEVFQDALKKVEWDEEQEVTALEKEDEAGEARGGRESQAASS
ncbi:hypothetical protein KEM52_001302 [Ascosphaera acerosa]|nr:hypothetical protein KEM52_001302 [Ascosphaera acerosa]